MSSPPRTSTPTGNAGRRPSINPSSSQSGQSRSPTRMAARTNTASAGSTSRTRSVRTGGAGTPISARAAVRKSTVLSSGATNVKNETDQNLGTDDDDSKAKTAAAIEDLQDRLQKAELVADDFQKQVSILQAHLDDTLADTGKLEDTVHEQQERIDSLEREKKESIRLRREIESIHEADRAITVKDKEASQAREETLLDTTRRLKETLAQRELRAGIEDERKPSLSRNCKALPPHSSLPANTSVASFRNSISPNIEGGQFAPPSSLQRSDSQRSSRLVLEKDKIIESLRLELAEVQIKLVGMENMGGGQVQLLEKTLMDARVANARLMEDNESFQLLLSEKALSGDFMSRDLLPPRTSSRPSSRRDHSSSLADELHGAADIDEEDQTRSQAEILSLKDQNKALTLYINNIISRLLQHGDFESILDKNPDMLNSNPEPAPRAVATDKDLPAPPPESDEPDAPNSFLSRTRSMIGGRPKPRPSSQTGTKVESHNGPSTNEDPATAPRIPLARNSTQRSVSGGHRRTNSEWASAAVVNNMYRGPSPSLSGRLSPGIASPPSSSFFGAVRPGSGTRVASSSTIPTISESERGRASTNRDSKVSSSGNSVSSNQEASNSSPPQSTTSSSEKTSGAIMAGGKLRTLRLVQERSDGEASRKAANRGSWMGWFNKGTARSASGERPAEPEKSLWPS